MSPPRSPARQPGRRLAVAVGLAALVLGCRDEEKTDEALYSEPPFPAVEMDALIMFTTFPVDMAAATVAWMITPGCAESVDEGVTVIDGACAGYQGTAEVTAPEGVFVPQPGATLDIAWQGWGVETPLVLVTMNGSSHAEVAEGAQFYSALETQAEGTLASADSGIFPVIWEDYVATDLGVWIEGRGELRLSGRILADGIGDFTVQGQLSRSLACPTEPDGRIVLRGDSRGDIELRPNGSQRCDGCLEWSVGSESGEYCMQQGEDGGGGGGGPGAEGEGSCYLECTDGPACGTLSVDQADCETSGEWFCGGAENLVRAEHVDCGDCDEECDPEWYP